MLKQANTSKTFYKGRSHYAIYMYALQLPPAKVNVANTYSASVAPASLWADINKLYQVAGVKPVITNSSCRGSKLLDTRTHSRWVFDLYWTTKNDIGQPPVFQECKFRMTNVVLMLRRALFSGAIGAATKILIIHCIKNISKNVYKLQKIHKHTWV